MKNFFKMQKILKIQILSIKYKKIFKLVKKLKMDGMKKVMHFKFYLLFIYYLVFFDFKN